MSIKDHKENIPEEKSPAAFKTESTQSTNEKFIDKRESSLKISQLQKAIDNSIKHPLQLAQSTNLAPNGFNMAGENHNVASVENDQQAMENAGMGNSNYWSEDKFLVNVSEQGRLDRVIGDPLLLNAIHGFEFGSHFYIKRSWAHADEYKDHQKMITNLDASQLNPEDIEVLTEDNDGILNDLVENLTFSKATCTVLKETLEEFESTGGSGPLDHKSDERITLIGLIKGYVADFEGDDSYFDKVVVNIGKIKGKAVLSRETTVSDEKLFLNIDMLKLSIIGLKARVNQLKATASEAYDKYDHEDRPAEDSSAARSYMMHLAATKAHSSGVSGLWKVGNAHVKDIIRNEQDIAYNLIAGDDWDTLTSLDNS